MKKIFFLVFIVLATLSCTAIKSTTNMGYDLVSWGSSVSTVKDVYNIGSEIQLIPSKDTLDILELKQVNISDNMYNRTFVFFDNKLVMVIVVYNDESYNNLLNLQAEFENKFGNITNEEEDLNDNSITRTISFGQYSPELFVKISYLLDHNLNINGGIIVTYYWEKGMYEYLTSLKYILSNIKNKILIKKQKTST